MKNKIYQNIAHLLPSKLVYFAFIRFMAHATTHKGGTHYQPDEMTFSKACELWEDKYGKV